MKKIAKTIAMAGCLGAMSGWADVILLNTTTNSVMSNFDNVTLNLAYWTEVGTKAVFTNGSGTYIARLDSKNTFSISAYTSVTLEFSVKVGSIPTGGSRLELGLIESSTVSNYSGGLSYRPNVYGMSAIVMNVATNLNPAGLVFNDGVTPQPGTDVNVAMTTKAGTVAYKIVYTTTGTELFQDGVSQGVTAQTLDFNKTYSLVVYGQGHVNSANLKEINSITLSAIPEPASLGIFVIGASSLILGRRFLQR